MFQDLAQKHSAFR